MDCPTEQTLIQNKLGKLAGVQQLEFNLINRVLGVTHNLPGTEPITEAIKSSACTPSRWRRASKPRPLRR